VASRYWKRNKETGKLEEIFPNKTNFSDGPIGNHINMRKTWSGTTKIEFNTITMDESIKRMNK
jgi:hypothetical protein